MILDTPKKQRKSKVPPKLPEWAAKCIWRATAKVIKVLAKNEGEAWHIAWRKVSRMEGGDSCLQVVILRRLK